jgi:hypothetical protein
MFCQLAKIIIKSFVDVEILKSRSFKIQWYFQLPLYLLCITHCHFSQINEICLVANQHFSDFVHIHVVSHQTFPDLYICKTFLLCEIKYVNDSNYVFKERGEKLVLIDFTGSVPKTCSNLTIDARLDGSPELATGILDTDSALM